MAFCTFSKEYSLSSYTSVENVFIYSYMPLAGDNAVKVYLYGLYLCQSSNDFSVADMARAIGAETGEIVDCFKYWEEFGLVEVVSDDPLMVNYLPIGASSKPRKINAEKYTEFNRSLQKILAGRMISTNEYSEYFRIMETFNIRQEAMLMIAQYCADIKGDDIGCKYISAVAKDFAGRGITTPEKVEKELENYIIRSTDIAAILAAMSVKRRPEIEDVKLFAKWTGEFGFELPAILQAARTLKRGSVKKLDELMLELYSNKKFSVEEISEFSKSRKYLYELAAKINKAISVYYEVLDPVVDNYTARWTAMGYDEQALLLVANYCFKRGRRSLEGMDKTLEGLYAKGIVDFESIVGYFKQVSKDDEFLRTVLDSVGQTRRPNEWDRQNLRQWRGWGFTDELILQAALCSAGKSSPFTYMNAVLSSWKSKGVFTPEEAAKITNVPQNAKKSKEIHFANERKYTEEELEALITDVDDIDI